MISAEALASARRLAEQGLPDECAIQRATLTADPYGGSTQTWVTVQTVAARVQAPRQTPAEGASADQVRTTVTYSIALPAAASVQPSDRLQVGTRTFEVSGVSQPSLSVVQRAACVEVTA